MTIFLGDDKARLFSEIHELNDAPLIERRTDRYNNHLGHLIGSWLRARSAITLETMSSWLRQDCLSITDVGLLIANPYESSQLTLSQDTFLRHGPHTDRRTPFK